MKNLNSGGTKSGKVKPIFYVKPYPTITSETLEDIMSFAWERGVLIDSVSLNRKHQVVKKIDKNIFECDFGTVIVKLI